MREREERVRGATDEDESRAVPPLTYPNTFSFLSLSFFEGDNASGKPIIWTIGVLFLLGYSLEYQHLKHHKNFEH